MNFREDLEKAKLSLYNAEYAEDVKNNPVVKATIVSLLKAVPILGELLDGTIDITLTKFQEQKRKELIDIILSETTSITADMVNDIEFIMNFAKTLEAVNRLSTNDKVQYFANLLKNSYFTNEKTENNEYEEWLRILSELSYREINYLVFLYEYQNENNKINDFNKNFRKKFSETFSVSEFEYLDVYKRLTYTGFVQEFFKIYNGTVQQNKVVNEYEEEFIINGTEMDTEYFWITEYFKQFVQMITNDKDVKKEMKNK
ncbi:MAG: hypothetical protein JJE17_00630 [Peptostreptococcaceae bacterium]|nr:hypothetical protein [Peptostreptococcaceae bacterium]